ncbi:barstar family protein [Devosia sp. 2618]|uniref:barstar family protein n=1 Tax=Devosia sp. 2618 TaxID=3156454 RepID=UPI003390933A
MQKKTLTIDGSHITDIASFYEEINRVFMSEEDWALGQSLDALNDMLFGGFGAIKGGEPIALIWTDFAASKAALGLEATRQFYQAKLSRPETYDVARITKDLAELEAGRGPTYFDIVLDIVADHPSIELVRR